MVAQTVTRARTARTEKDVQARLLAPPAPRASTAQKARVLAPPVPRASTARTEKDVQARLIAKSAPRASTAKQSRAFAPPAPRGSTVNQARILPTSWSKAKGIAPPAPRARTARPRAGAPASIAPGARGARGAHQARPRARHVTVAMLESPAAGDNFVLAQLPSEAHCSVTAPLKAQGGACSRAGPLERSLGNSVAPLSCGGAGPI